MNMDKNDKSKEKVTLGKSDVGKAELVNPTDGPEAGGNGKSAMALVDEDYEAALLSPQDFARLARDGAYTIDMTVSLKDPGQGILGTFLGEGPVQEVGEPKILDHKTGEYGRDRMRTWYLRLGDKFDGPEKDHVVTKGRVKLRLMGKHGINSFLAGVAPGSEVGIQMVGREQRGGKQINLYMTMSRALKDAL